MVNGTEQALAFGSETRPFTPTHISHKQVEAYPLVGLAEEEGGHLVAHVQSDQGLKHFKVPSNIIARGYPKPGDMLVRYAPTASDPKEYFSFSPREAFETGYSAIQPAEHHKSYEGGGRGLTFGQAIEQMKAGDRVARDGWNGRGMHLALVTTWSGNVGPAPEQYALLPFICMRTVQADFVPWLASQTDMLAEDWCVV